MKLTNAYIGLRVQVKNGKAVGRKVVKGILGSIVQVDHKDELLGVKVQFDNNLLSWAQHDHLRIAK